MFFPVPLPVYGSAAGGMGRLGADTGSSRQDIPASGISEVARGYAGLEKSAGLQKCLFKDDVGRI